MGDSETLLKLNRLERYEKALTDIANMESGKTQNKAVMMARKTLTDEYLGKRD